MLTLMTVLIALVGFLLIATVLIQNPKGGGLSGGIGSAASNVIGVQSAGDVMEKTTWGSAIALLALCVMTAFVVPKVGSKEQVKTLTEGAAKSTVPSLPTAPPAQQAPQNPTQPAK